MKEIKPSLEDLLARVTPENSHNEVFTMSMYASEKDLYKAKAEYYERKLKFAVSLLKDALNADDDMCVNFLGSRLYNQIEEFTGEVDNE